MKTFSVWALTLLMLASPVSAASVRFQSYQKWVKHYQVLMGLEDRSLTFVHYHHPNYCAWVAGPQMAGFDAPITVGLSEPDWVCGNISTRKLALHEMCHLRMQHLDPSLILSDKAKHQEVFTCMKWYEERDGEE